MSSATVTPSLVTLGGRVDLGHRLQDGDRAERIAGRHLEHIDRLHQRALGDGGHATRRRVAGEHVHHARREGAQRDAVAMMVDALHPPVERGPVVEVGVDVAPQALDDEVARLLQVDVGVEVESCAQFHQEVDDLCGRHLQQRRQLAAWGDQFVEVDRGRGEIHAHVARGVLHRAAGDHPAAHEVVDTDHAVGSLAGQGGTRLERAHDSPRTYASTVPEQPILSSPFRSA